MTEATSRHGLICAVPAGELNGSRRGDGGTEFCSTRYCRGQIYPTTLNETFGGGCGCDRRRCPSCWRSRRQVQAGWRRLLKKSSTTKKTRVRQRRQRTAA